MNTRKTGSKLGRKGGLWRIIFIAWLDEEVLNPGREYRRVMKFGAGKL